MKLHKQKLETTIILLPTLLLTLSTLWITKAYKKLYRIPQETLVGVYNNIEKYEREG